MIPAGVPDVSIIVPCYREVDNVAPLVAALDRALAGRAWEVIFVDDDSPDGTIDAVRALAAHDPRVRGLRRIGRRGLSSAVIEGALASSAQVIAVMDGDLQHDETRLPQMIDAVAAGTFDIAVGSRHVAGGTATGLSSPWRHRLSESGIGLARALIRPRLTDPMSGFFALRRETFDALAPRLSGHGFKILLDLVMSAPEPLRALEVPFEFRARLAGESKLDVLVMVQFLAMLVDRATGGVLPLRFLAFAAIGAIGVAVNLAVLALAGHLGGGFVDGQAAGMVVSTATNFWLNNVLTYRDRRLRGGRLWWGLALFMVVCGIGGLANVGIASMLVAAHHGWTLAAIAGALMSVVWNYAVSSTLVWRAR